MKNRILLLLSILFLTTQNGLSQEVGPPVPLMNQLDANFSLFANLNSFTRVDYAIIKIPKLSPKAQGTIYRYEDYQNNGFLQMNKKLFKLNNINFNVLNNTIESRVSKDSVYVFNLQNVDYAIINNKKYMSVWLDDDRRIVELVHKGDKYTLVRDYEIEIRRVDPANDPLQVKRQKNASFHRVSQLWIRKADSSYERIKINKKGVLNLLSDKKAEVKKFVKGNKLSYKKDIHKILALYDVEKPSEKSNRQIRKQENNKILFSVNIETPIQYNSKMGL